ncbi:MAG TPA: hypothetical protein VG871_02790, partial [Vicinamibacterales bacterium]|nr:hypothetical protein [Vicinamibacterales bacterium]
MSRTSVVVSVCAAALLAAAVMAGAQQAPSALVDRQHKRMQPEAVGPAFGNGVQMIVYGDPAKPGLYAIRRRFKPGEMTHPH